MCVVVGGEVDVQSFYIAYKGDRYTLTPYFTRRNIRSECVYNTFYAHQKCDKKTLKITDKHILSVLSIQNIMLNLC